LFKDTITAVKLIFRMKSLSLTSRKGGLLRKQHEFFRISKYARTFDRRTNKFVVNIAYETAAPEPSERVVAVAEGFGLGLDQWEKFVVYDNVELKIGPTDIVYVTGDSGSGKSVLLKALERDIRNDLAQTRINVAEAQPEPDKPLNETVGKTAEEAMKILSKVGLGDAFLSG
jgi:ABC-type ATPase with predicted acetyltransferase domain